MICKVCGIAWREGEPLEPPVQPLVRNMLEWLRVTVEWLPTSNERPGQQPSNSELRRWFKDKAIRVNGEFPVWDGPPPECCWDLVFFPKGKRCTTVWYLTPSM